MTAIRCAIGRTTSATHQVSSAAARKASTLGPPPTAAITKGGVTAAVPAGAMAATDCANTGAKASRRRRSPLIDDRCTTSGGVGVGTVKRGQPFCCCRGSDLIRERASE
ncbi:hypothetical protein ACFXO7_02200 [Nocardia tengchongensis]|uniref:hypothetical protein n=1 Tax=Nocardia tengchongensis TaxID=2055889 RepID=UPI0036A52877